MLIQPNGSLWGWRKHKASLNSLISVKIMKTICLGFHSLQIWINQWMEILGSVVKSTLKQTEAVMLDQGGPNNLFRHFCLFFYSSPFRLYINRILTNKVPRAKHEVFGSDITVSNRDIQLIKLWSVEIKTRRSLPSIFLHNQTNPTGKKYVHEKFIKRLNSSKTF